MKNLHTVAAVTASLFIAGIASAQDLTIRWGTEAGYKPFMYKTSGGDLTGFDYEIGVAICTELNAECTWTEQDWDGIIPGLLARRYDAILASMSITDERQQVVDFTDAYYKISDRFVGRIDANLDDGAGLSGKTVGVMRGTTNATYLLETRPDLTVREYPSQDEMLLDLANGRIDAGFIGEIAITDGFLKTENGNGFALFGAEYTDPKYFGDGTGIAVRKEDPELREAINTALQTLQENGVYAEINSRYFAFDISAQ